jgi:hypothetical protein
VNESRRRAITFALLGVISGGVSVAGIIPFAPPNDFGLLAMFVLPGFAFGAIIGLALAYDGWLSAKRVLAWVVFATLGHFVAALCVTALTWRLQAALPLRELPAILIAAALGGGLGGGILAVANRLLVPGSHWIGPTMVGAILGPLVRLHDAGPVLGRLLFYMIWQGGYAATLAVALPASRRVSQAKKQREKFSS